VNARDQTKTGKEALHRDLEAELKKLRRKKQDLDPMVIDLKHQLRVTDERIIEVERRLANMKPANLTVSEHCILRYAERHYKVPVDQIAKEILDKVRAVSELGDVQALGFVIRNNVVVTYKPTEYPE